MNGAVIRLLYNALINYPNICSFTQACLRAGDLIWKKGLLKKVRPFFSIYRIVIKVSVVHTLVLSFPFKTCFFRVLVFVMVSQETAMLSFSTTDSPATKNIFTAPRSKLTVFLAYSAPCYMRPLSLGQKWY